MDLFSVVSAEEMRMAQFVTGATMAAFIGVRFAPGLREHAGTITLALLVLYLLTGCGFVAYVLLR